MNSLVPRPSMTISRAWLFAGTSSCLAWLSKTGANKLLLNHIPHVQEGGVGGGRNPSSALPCCAIQSGTNFFLRRGQVDQRHLKRRAGFQRIEVLQNGRDNQLVLPISTL